MEIRKLEKQDILDVVSLWNQQQEEGVYLYEPLTTIQFHQLFIETVSSLHKLNYVCVDENEVIGFVNGCYFEGEETGYLTFVLVKEEFKRHGIGTRLLKELESQLKAIQSIEKVDLIFFNPIHLSWGIPHTMGHLHPNAPGVDVKSDAYLFFKNQGYKDVVYQNSYYRQLKGFEYSKSIEARIQALKEKNIKITYYNPSQHHGWGELFADLNNSLWEETITENINREDGGDPILIVEHEGLICGFTGPLKVEAGKRGYFCGIGIHSDYRQYGAGKVLFSVLCKGLEEMGADYMSLFTGENNPARYIYESNQFKIVRTWADMRKEFR